MKLVAEETAKVLVVDDTAANLLALGAVLKPLGVQVVEARSGVEALAFVESETFAVALLDVQMPDMDGFELAKRIRATQSGVELPILFLSPIQGDELHVKRGYQSGGADYITKPFDPDVLRARVKAFVDLFQQRERLRVRQLERLLESERAARRDAEIANNAKDEFLATVSHELRTPLNAILGWSIIARDMAREPQVQRALSTIERNARSQMRIIEDVLDIGRIISGKLRLEMSEISAEEPIRGAVEAVRPAAHAKEVTLTIDIAADVGKLYADSERLQQVAWNLLSNAIKFASQHGRVSLTVRRERGALLISVEDDGQGIPAEFLPHVFEPFRQADGSTTRRHGGLGLGLAIVKQLVQAHGGTVHAESRGSGLGSTFVVRLPVRSPPQPAHVGAERASVRPGEPRLSGLDVLVVDDDDDARSLLQHVLESHGAHVVAAASAAAALEAFGESPPDIILSDISMPNIDGYGLIQRVRALPDERGGKTPAIAVTAHAKGPLTERVFEAGFQAHVTKPIDPKHLVFLVANVTGLG